MVPLPTDDGPRPRSRELAVEALVWPVARVVRGWQAAPLPLGRAFGDVLAARRSHRTLLRPSTRLVADLVAAATLPTAILDGDPLQRHRTVVPSAGALHPISVVFVGAGLHAAAFRVEPWSGMLQALRPADPGSLRAARDALLGILPAGGGATLVLLLGHTAMAEAAYTDAASLIWRDAGVLLATLHLVATASGLGFCPLGALGTAAARALFPRAEHVVGCGAAAVGIAA